MPEQGQQRDQPAEAVAQHHLGADRQGRHGHAVHHPGRGAGALGVVAPLLAEEEGEVIHEGADAVRIAPDAAGPAEAAVVHAGHGPAQAMQPVGRVPVALAMLAVAVGDHHPALGLGVLPARPGQGHAAMARQDPTGGGLQIGGQDAGSNSGIPPE